MSKVLDQEIVKKTAYNARLDDNPSDEFLEKYSKELGSIIDYIDELNEVNTTGISPLDGVRTNAIQELREDETTENETNYQRIRLNIIEQFPNRKGNLLELPGIFD
ncbi:hypothetical protein HC766_05215 [Candidatus Gracilibacteria bacterium]|nr:hypothetical protein [Candidatus Gracilibacteria bacterium]NJS41710.1 hypothetical protein [Candidatus Gracilibacteria bacterium]